MKNSKYADAIKRAKEKAGERGFIIPGALLLVERLPAEEIKTKSGLIIADASKLQINSIVGDAPVMAMVVALGEGFINESGDAVKLDTEIGAILVVGDHSVRWLSTFPIEGYAPNTLGLCNEEQTQIRFRNSDAYEAFKKGSSEATG